MAKSEAGLSDPNLVEFSPSESRPMISDQDVEDGDLADETHMSIDWTSCQTSTFEICTPEAETKTLTLCNRSTTIEPINSPLFRVKTMVGSFQFLIQASYFEF